MGWLLHAAARQSCALRTGLSSTPVLCKSVVAIIDTFRSQEVQSSTNVQLLEAMIAIHMFPVPVQAVG